MNTLPPFQHERFMKPLRPLWEFITSVKLTLFLLAGIAIMLVAGTIVETKFSTEAALAAIYRSPLMDALIGLLGINQVTCTIKRWPYKPHQMGWLLAHLGVIVILIGSIYGRAGQRQGQIFLTEGETTDSFVSEFVQNGQKATYAVPLGFMLTLQKFELHTYPGTNMASDYRSTVVATDPERGREYRHTIRVNDPLMLRGYVIAQQSYVPGDPASSVFSVLKNPGTPVIFTGFTIMSVGLAVIVFLKSWLRKRYPPHEART